MDRTQFKRSSIPPRKTGFALVVTISLMVLLSLLAVGLLSLSTISLRASSGQGAMTEARANARLALMLALGELQKSVGPDQVITAQGGLLDDTAPRARLTGVWDSWDPLADAGSGSPDYAEAKESSFRSWLVSDSDPEALSNLDYPGPQGDPIELLGSGTLGVDDPAPQDVIRAGRVPVVSNGRESGGYAWHVADESVKARINAYQNPSREDFSWRKVSLVAGHRPDASVIRGTDGALLDFLPGDETVADFRASDELAGKLIDPKQFELLDGGRSIGPFRHHVTPYSFGLLSDVRDGGLKQDLTSVFEMPGSAMPAAFQGGRIYESTHGLTGPSDPYWSTLDSYYETYKNSTMMEPSPYYSQRPSERVDITDTRFVPKSFYAAPVIARVEMLFSVVVRDSHGPWSANRTGLSDHTRMVHLLYAPIVTLHNPYNVPLRFDQMDIDINGVPIAFNFIVNGEAQNQGPVPYNQMYVNLANRAQKSFNLSIADWQGFNSSSTSPITMQPGQSLVCGPYIDGSAIFGNAGHEGSRVFFDFRNNLTGDASARAKCKPGFLGQQVAFDVDWITPDNGPYSTDGRRGVLIVKPRDNFYIEYQMKPNEFGGRVTEEMTVTAKMVDRRREVEIGGLKFEYDDRSIGSRFPTVYRYPDSQSRPNALTVERLWESNQTPIRDQVRVKPFALVTARARTANGGVYETGSREENRGAQNILADGDLAGQPLLHHNPARTPTVVDFKRDLPGRYSHELTIQPLRGSVADLYDIDATNRGNLLTGNTTAAGIKSGSYLELPTGPMQTIADFRRSNALTTSMLPHFVQPVANSYPSPLMARDKHTQDGIVEYPLLDHSVLANHAFYDRFYFSTLANYDARTTPEDAFVGFVDGSRPLASQGFEPYLPPGMTVDDAKKELFSSGAPTPDAYERVSKYQLTRSPFNVNSVDVEAWKAVLSSMSGSQVQLMWATSGLNDEEAAEDIPFTPMGLTNARHVGGFDLAKDRPNIDDDTTNDFNGYRQLDSTQLEQLAIEIVEEVKERGPFLSMSEFVNRRLENTGPISGALQTAIDEAGINDNFLQGRVVPVTEADLDDRRLYNFETPEASVGNPAAGAPGWLSQGDIMRVLEPGATVRGDTFVIRTYGEAVDANGVVLARAYAEAVVQRYPEYLDPADEASVNVWDSSGSGGSEVNRRFGRKLSLVSFRWLSPEEV